MKGDYSPLSILTVGPFIIIEQGPSVRMVCPRDFNQCKQTFQEKIRVSLGVRSTAELPQVHPAMNTATSAFLSIPVGRQLCCFVSVISGMAEMS